MALISEQLTNMKFVQEVEKHPCLYNTEISEYLRKDITEEAWKQVSGVMSLPVHICKEKWKNVRVVFVRYLRALSMDKKRRKPYYLFDLMQFWAPYAKVNVTVEEVNIAASGSIQSENYSKADSSELNEEFIKSEYMDESSSETFQEYSKRRIDDHGVGYAEKKRVRRSTSDSVVSNACDPVVAFLNSILPELQELDQSQFNVFKRRALGLIDNIKSERYD